MERRRFFAALGALALPAKAVPVPAYPPMFAALIEASPLPAATRARLCAQLAGGR